MNNKYLPIGTIVDIKGLNQKIMILGFFFVDKKNKSITYDYNGCIYPQGIRSSNDVITFNHSDIIKTHHIGLKDSEWDVLIRR